MFQSNPHFQDSLASAPGLQSLAGGQAPPAVTVALILLVVGLVVLAAWVARDRRPSGRQWRPRGAAGDPVTPAPSAPPGFRAPPTPAPGTPSGLRDPARQMHAIAGVGFRTVPLMNRSEARLFPALERAVRAFDARFRLHAQTSLGEIIKPHGPDATPEALDAAYFSINAKRLDFAVFNGGGHIVVAIEYQGHGHYHTDSFMRDAVKREALRKAGVPFLELAAGVSPDDAADQLTAALRKGAEPVARTA